MTTVPGRVTTIFQSHNHHYPSKACGQHQRTLMAAKEEKRQAKKQLRALRMDGTKPEELRVLAHNFRRLVQKYSKLCQEETHRERRRSRQWEQRDCHKNFWRFTKFLLNEDVTPVYCLHSPVKLLRTSLCLHLQQHRHKQVI